MQEENVNWKSKFDHSQSQLEEIKLAYSNLLHDVLSFNELLSKKDSSADILKLVLRLSRSIIDFKAGVIFKYDGDELHNIHSINFENNFEQHVKSFLEDNKYDGIIIKQRFDLIAASEKSTYIVMPLITKQQTVGMLDILVDIPANNIRNQDLDLLWILCSIAAIEYESLEMSSRSEILSLMLTSLEIINSEDKLDTLLYLILNNIKQIVPAASYLLILRDKFLELSSNIKYCLPEIHSLDETCEIVNECIQKRETIFIKKLSSCERCRMCTESYLHKEHDGSLMLVPLHKAKIGYGVICIYDKDINGKIFSQYNRHIIEIFAKQATIAINNAILLDKQKKSNLSLAEANGLLSKKNVELDNKHSELLLNQQKLRAAMEEINKKNKILSKEIESAGVVQKAILSKADKPEYIDLYVYYKPHHSIGGDFFGIDRIDENRTFIYIGDVSGKGVPAAITTGFLKNEFAYTLNKYKYQKEISPGKILSDVNLSSMQVFKVTEQFTSAWCGIIDNTNKTLTYASAGHDYPILISKEVKMIDHNNGPIMGLFDSLDYNDDIIQFPNPDTLILYTDGITDQELTDGTRLNRDWLLQQAYEKKTKTPKDLCNIISQDIIKMSQGVPQHDDMLMIVLSFKKDY